MATLVTLDQAKQHLRLPVGTSSPPSDLDIDLQLKLDIAEELVLDTLRQRIADADAWAAEVALWDAATAPRRVLAAILLMVTYLWRFRGDDSEGPDYEAGALPPDVTRCLYRLRDPGVA